MDACRFFLATSLVFWNLSVTLYDVSDIVAVSYIVDSDSVHVVYCHVQFIADS